MSVGMDSFGPGAIWQPSGKFPTEGHLVVVLHGRGDSPKGFTWFQSELNLPDVSVLLLPAPDPYYDGLSWYDLPPDQLPGIKRSRKILEDAFHKLLVLGFPPERCFLFGFSQGCLMTLEFGARFPLLLAGYIGVSGYCYDPFVLLKEASKNIITSGNWLITHGTLDSVLPVEKTRAQIKELIEGGFAIDYREFPKLHTIEPEHEMGAIREWIKKRLYLKS